MGPINSFVMRMKRWRGPLNNRAAGKRSHRTHTVPETLHRTGNWCGGRRGLMTQSKKLLVVCLHLSKERTWQNAYHGITEKHKNKSLPRMMLYYPPTCLEQMASGQQDIKSDCKSRRLPPSHKHRKQFLIAVDVTHPN